MSKDKDKKITKTLRALADEKDPPVNQVGKPSKGVTSKSTQEEHESALVSFQTKREGDMNLSLNSLKKKKHDEDDP